MKRSEFSSLTSRYEERDKHIMNNKAEKGDEKIV
jgi:hypothetical protein